MNRSRPCFVVYANPIEQARNHDGKLSNLFKWVMKENFRNLKEKRALCVAMRDL